MPLPKPHGEIWFQCVHISMYVLSGEGRHWITFFYRAYNSFVPAVCRYILEKGECSAAGRLWLQDSRYTHIQYRIYREACSYCTYVSIICLKIMPTRMGRGGVKRNEWLNESIHGEVIPVYVNPGCRNIHSRQQPLHPQSKQGTVNTFLSRSCKHSHFKH